MIPHNKPTIGQEEIKAVTEEKGKAFEDTACRYLGLEMGRAVALSSGTAALYLALILLGIGQDDEVITSTYVCSAVLNAIYLTGAKPVLVDINSSDFTSTNSTKMPPSIDY